MAKSQKAGKNVTEQYDHPDSNRSDNPPVVPLTPTVSDSGDGRHLPNGVRVRILVCR